MDIPTLSSEDKKSWAIFQALEDDDLYSILGAEPLYKPVSTPEALLMEVTFLKTKQTVLLGKQRFQQIKETVREKICNKWKSLKEQVSTFNQEMVVALVLESVRSFCGASHFPCEAAAELICRACHYSLDKFCENLLN
ncbi:MAG: hypothetical protein FJ134_10020 [Deltaproteobacteria bacterium]|nr:hypothetical protein [Deltaproteobacteria bacterium]